MSHYHEIFNHGISYNTLDKIALLEKYMYTQKFIQKHCSNSLSTPLSLPSPFQEPVPKKYIPETLPTIVEPEPINVVPTVAVVETMIYPEKKDNLFWSIYISIYGYETYHLIERRYQNAELEEKQKIVEFIKKNPNEMKNSNHKITKINMQEMMSDLLTNTKIELSVLVALALFYNKRIIIIQGEQPGFYLEIYPISLENDRNQVILLTKNKKQEYGVDLDITPEKIMNIENNMLKFQHYEKPLKAISNYKVDELENIASKLNIDMSKKYKKPELYMEIAKMCIW
jgi:hypothetical protein